VSYALQAAVLAAGATQKMPVKQDRARYRSCPPGQTPGHNLRDMIDSIAANTR